MESNAAKLGELEAIRVAAFYHTLRERASLGTDAALRVTEQYARGVGVDG